MESIDDLLAQVKAEFDPQHQAKEPLKKPLFTPEELREPTSIPTYISQVKPIYTSPA